MGSSDPHGTGSVSSFHAGRAAMAAHVAASEAELLCRPFAEVNCAPETEPLPPPPAPPANPPRVTCVEQVVLAATLRLVRAWTRRLRRCLRMAARGDGRRAARFRPEDVWLEHNEHTLPGYEAWDWDFRPLAWGGDAVPLQASGRDGVQPATGLALEVVRQLSEGFADQAVVSEMLMGLCDDSQCRRGTLLCAPHTGALQRFDVAAAKLATSEAQGWATTHATVPCWPLRTCPYSVVDESERAGKPKFRLTTDLSWPHVGAMWAGETLVDSVNDGMDRSRWPENRLVQVRQFAEAAAILRGVGGSRRVRTWSLDCEAFYRAVGRQRAEIWRNGVWTSDGVQLDERCCFGDASAATKCARISNFVVHCVRAELRRLDAEFPTCDAGWLEWQAARRSAAVACGGDPDEWAALHWLGMYIDDAMACGADDVICSPSGVPVVDDDGRPLRRQTMHFRAARAVLERLGWSSAAAKEQPPAERVEVLGVVVDLQAERVWLTDGKRARYSALAEQVAESRVVSQRELQAVVGRLQFAAQFYPLGRQFMHAAQRAMRAVSRMQDGEVRVSRALYGDMRWWVARLRDDEHDGVPLAACSMASTPLHQDGVIYADASGAGGFAAWTVRDGEVLLVADEWTSDECGMLICELELLILSLFPPHPVAMAALLADSTPTALVADFLPSPRARQHLQRYHFAL